VRKPPGNDGFEVGIQNENNIKLNNTGISFSNVDYIEMALD
jgi:hypothetical protein